MCIIEPAAPYLAIINVLGYLPENDPGEHETTGEAWADLAETWAQWQDETCDAFAAHGLAAPEFDPVIGDTLARLAAGEPCPGDVAGFWVGPDGCGDGLVRLPRPDMPPAVYCFAVGAAEPYPIPA